MTEKNVVDFNSPDRKARRIDSAETFKIEIVFTIEMQEKLRKMADQGCPICLGRGLHDTTTKGWQMCSCLDV